MRGIIFLDSDLIPAFHPDMDTAKKMALLEAANTGGIIFSVNCVEVSASLTLVGSLPRASLQKPSKSNPGRSSIKCQGLGWFHTTWGALIRPDDYVGHLVIHQPAALVSGSVPDEEIVRLALPVKRKFNSLPSGLLIGRVCCSNCNEVIPPARLIAVPGIRTCVNCQQTKEARR